MNIKRTFAGALLSGSLAVAGMGIASPIAQADPASAQSARRLAR